MNPLDHPEAARYKITNQFRNWHASTRTDNKTDPFLIEYHEKQEHRRSSHRLVCITCSLENREVRGRRSWIGNGAGWDF
jgi:hypothetical protein